MSDDHARRSQPVLIVGILGRIRARSGGQELDLGGPRQRALLAALAVEVGRTVPTDTLIDAVWDGDPPEAADRTFRSYVSRLRKALGRTGVDGAEIVHTDAAGYRLDDHLAAVDAQLFAAEVAEAREQLAAGQAADAAGQLAGALDRWEGQALGAFADRVWAAPTSVRLEEERLAAEELRVRALLDADRMADAVTLIGELAAAEPLRESVARLHALALYRAGRDADALQTAREFRERLVDEHGLDPSPQLSELESMILTRDPRLDRPAGGQRLRGYVLHEVLASTPIGTVHRAEQPSIGRDVAVTVVPAKAADDPELVRLFESRMQQVASVEHRRVVPLYDYWRHPGGAYLVTRLPGGGTLAQQLARGRVGPDETVRVLREVAQGVAAAHERGVVHGALSTDAVVLDEQGHAFLWGFSLLPPEEGPRGDLAALAALADELVSRVGVGVAAGRDADAVAELARAASTPTDDRVSSAAGFARTLDDLGRGDDTTTVTPPPATSGPNPYRGLAAFRETDAEVFFGRDELTRAIITRLARQPFVAVFGPSGSGKSSVVRAGVLPRLRSEGAYVTTMVPGVAPIAELGVALSRIAAVELPDVEERLLGDPNGLTGVIGDVLPTPEAEAVIVVDQFEELLTMTPENERAAFLGVLRDAIDHPLRRVRVIATVRADFLGRVLDDPVAGQLVHDRSVLARPLTADELYEVVVGPAEVVGVAVEPALATAIVADATRFPGSLPMVQFALTEVFEAAEDATMELAAYRRIGGIEGVLGQRAEEVYAGLDDAGQRAAHQLFERLVVPNDEGPPTRRRAHRAELAHVPDEVVEAFGEARLLRFDHDEESREPTVEVTHEALFPAWPRLMAWIEEGEDDLRLLGHLTVSAEEWDDGGRREADLYRGHRLDAAQAFAADRRDELSATERAFLDASTARRAREAAAERRTVRRLRALTGGLAVGLVLALVAGALAVGAQRDEVAARQEEGVARREAEAARAEAESAAERERETARRAQADSLAYAASSTYGDDPDLGILYAAEAYAATGSAAAQRALLETLTTDPRIVRVWDALPGRCQGRSPDGDQATAVVPDVAAGTARVTVQDTAEQRVRDSHDVPGEISCVVPDASGRWLVAQLEQPELRVLDAATGEQLSQVAVEVDGGVPVQRPNPVTPEVVVSGDGRPVTVHALPSLELLATHEHDVPIGFRHPVWSDRGDALLLPFPGAVRVVTGQETLEIPYAGEPGAYRSVGAIDERRLLLVATADELQVIPYDDPDAATSIALRGEPAHDTTRRLYNGLGVAVLSDGRTVGIPTSQGLELIDVVAGAHVGAPVELDAGSIAFFPDREGRVLASESHTNLAIDPYRVTHVGTALGDRPTGLGAKAGAAVDGSSYVVFDDAPSVQLLRSGEEVELPPAAPGFTEITGTVGVGLLRDEEWVRLDLTGASFERWSGDELVMEVDLSGQIPTGMSALGQVLDTTDEHVLAIVTDDPTVRGGYVLVLDHRTGDVVGFFDPDDEVRGPRTFGVFVGDDRVMTYHLIGTVGLWTLDGEPAPGHVNVPQAAYGFDANADGSVLAVGRNDGTIGLLDAEGELTGELTGVAALAFELAFVGDHRLVSRHLDGTTRLWDLDTGELMGTLLQTGSQPPAWAVTIDDDGRLLHPSPEGLLRLDLDPDAWLEAACRVVARGLRPEEAETVAPGWELLDPCGTPGVTAATTSGG